MNRTIFQGVGTALITPMKENYEVNYEALEQILEYQVHHKADAIVITGTTGEASTLTQKEQIDVISFTVKTIRNRIPVVAGVGSNNTSHAVELSIEAEQAGVDGLLHVTPYYNKTSQKGLALHFGACAKAVSIPILLYHIPGRTGMTIQTNTYERLLEYDNIVGVKEAGGDFSQIADLMAKYPGRLDLYSGNDDQVTAALSMGAKGVISVLSNILPEEVHQMCQSYLDGDAVESRRIQLTYLELIRALFSDVNPIPIKQAMNDMGLKAGPCRLPLCEMEDVPREKLYQVLKKYQLISGLKSVC